MADIKKLNWEEFVGLTNQLAAKILASGIRIEMLVGLARGGLIPARLLSDRLGVNKISSIGLRYEDESRTQLSFYSLPSPIIVGQNVLLIEDFLESGNSLVKATELFKVQGAFVNTASIFVGLKSIVIPDFYVIKSAMPVSFPWE